MGRFASGQVVLIPFPFSDLSRSKFRPALLLASAGRGDWIACQITSNSYGDERAVALEDTAFATGGLNRVSYVRPAKLFTANESLIADAVGVLRPHVLASMRDAVSAVVHERPSPS